jgi:hypothetical protein
MTPQSIITTARYIVNDTDPLAYRQSDAEMLRYVIDGLREICKLQPLWFSAVAPFTCVVGAEQTLAFADAEAIIDVPRITNGAALTVFDKSVLDAFSPGWKQATAAAAKQWSPDPNDPLRFFVNPPAIAGQSLDVQFVAPVTSVALNDTITQVPDSLEPTLADYVISRAESKDDEHVNSGRANSHLTAFIAKIKPAKGA